MKRTFSLIFLCISLMVHADQLVEFDETNELPLPAALLNNEEKTERKEKTPSLTFEDYFNRGTHALRSGDIDTAIHNLELSKQSKSIIPQTHFNLGLAYETKGNSDAAIEAYKDALLQKLDYPKAHLQLANLLQRKGDIDQAIVHFEQALAFDQGLVEPACRVARLLCEKERFEDALEYFERFIEKEPNNLVVKFEYANALTTAHQPEKALTLYQELLQHQPNDASILANTGYALKKIGQIKEAMPYYEAVLVRNPDHAEAHFSLATAHLILGDFKRGWPEYEWRWKRTSQLSPRNFQQPVWDGTPLNGKTILLHAEQGLGDTFQFIRYAKVIKENYNGTVIFASQHPLETFIARCCPYIDRVVTLHSIPTTFDTHAPLLSLPFILQSDEETIPRDIPYIIPDATLVEFWRRQLADDPHFKVGICWQGNSKYSTPFLRAVVAAKSMALKKFATLDTIKGVSFYSLQKENGTEQLKGSPTGFKLTTFENDFDQSRGRFMDTAAVIKNLDLVITIDTSIAHLAAAIGIETWVILPEPPDWRWMLERTDTPWYPNMRLFRQPTRGDWDSIMDTVAAELEKLLSNKNTPLVHHLTETEKENIPTKATTTDLQKSFDAVSDLNKELSLIKKELHKTTTTIALLNKELALVHSQLKQTTKELISLKGTTDNKAFMTKLRVLYHLCEMQNGIKEHISQLEDEECLG